MRHPRGENKMDNKTPETFEESKARSLREWEKGKLESEKITWTDVAEGLIQTPEEIQQGRLTAKRTLQRQHRAQTLELFSEIAQEATQKFEDGHFDRAQKDLDHLKKMIGKARAERELAG
jgi:hypothetical protein